MLQSLFVWANLPYAIAFTVAVLFALLQMTGVLGLLAGGDHEGDHDHDVDADGDADVDADADADHDGDADVDGDGDHDLGDKILIDLGVGRVPFSLVWQTFAMAFGVGGLAVNAIYLGRGGVLSPVTLAWTIPLALLFAYGVTRIVSRLLGRVIANPDQEATSRQGLVGTTGIVISTRINDEFGEVRVKDRTGHFVHIVCRTREGEPPIPAGREIVIVEYNPDNGRLFVAPLDDDEPSPARIAPQAGEQRTGAPGPEAEAEEESAEEAASRARRT
ncbi:OB-fold-containig protein [Polyangium aurulentum]|uniref:OB-fold-containig protein n=1 Tax=Polyangium aurulentum TaxID=2567896 RepID=UPI00146F17F8|nr:OB-fold-containig protein [Polyangium aurulentum]UQA60787.1 YqiJ family protein [Polyangium aurulentum]